MEACRLALAMNLDNFAFTQYGNYGFNSFAEIGGKLYGSNENGIYELESGDTHAGTAISSYFEFWIGDVGAINIKRIRAIHIGGSFSGDMVATLTDDDGTSQTFGIDVEKTGKEHCGLRFFIPRSMHGRYWKLKIANVGGNYFSVNSIHVTWNVLAGSKQAGF